MTDLQHTIEIIGVAIELVAVAIIVVGLGFALVQCAIAFTKPDQREFAYRRLRNLSARILLLGLELLVAADIVRTVALEPSLESVAVLGLLVVIRTFLSWSLIVELEGRWPWQVQTGAPGRSERSLVSGLSTTAVLGLFLFASLATWAAGVVLADTTDVLDDRLGLGDALGGLILLGFAGTLPEIAITVSAAHSGDLGLATGNLLGGIAMQTLVLVLLDAVSGSHTPLTALSTVLEPIVEALLVIILLAVALLGHLLPATDAIGSVSPTSILLVVVWFGGVLLLNRLRTSQRWRAVSEHIDTVMVAPAPSATTSSGRFGRASTRGVILAFAGAAAVTLAAGVGLERTSNELAGRWGLSGVLFGATILAAATALPEVSTGLRAVRLGRVGLAMGDIFGGNQVQLTLFLLADLVAGQPVLQTVTSNTAWLGGVGLIVTALYTVGLVVRPPRKLLGVGPDSLLVLLAYLVGLAGLVRIS